MITKVRHARKSKAQKRREKFAREYHSDERRQHLVGLGCVVQLHGFTPGPCSGNIENAHTETGGVGRKADYRKNVPMCSGHHGELHQTGIRTFEKTYGLDLALSATVVEISWSER